MARKINEYVLANIRRMFTSTYDTQLELKDEVVERMWNDYPSDEVLLDALRDEDCATWWENQRKHETEMKRFQEECPSGGDWYDRDESPGPDETRRIRAAIVALSETNRGTQVGRGGTHILAKLVCNGNPWNPGPVWNAFETMLHPTEENDSDDEAVCEAQMNRFTGSWTTDANGMPKRRQDDSCYLRSMSLKDVEFWHGKDSDLYFELLTD